MAAKGRSGPISLRVYSPAVWSHLFTISGQQRDAAGSGRLQYGSGYLDAIKSRFYVDDYLSSAASVGQGVKEARAMKDTLAKADLHLQNWSQIRPNSIGRWPQTALQRRSFRSVALKQRKSLGELSTKRSSSRHQAGRKEPIRIWTEDARTNATPKKSRGSGKGKWNPQTRWQNWTGEAPLRAAAPAHPSGVSRVYDQDRSRVPSYVKGRYDYQLSFIRQHFWILRERQLVKKV